MYFNLLSTVQKTHITEARAVLAPLLSLVTRAIQESQVHESSFLPIYPKFKAMRQLRNSLMATRFENYAVDAHMRRVLIMELAEEVRNRITNFEKPQSN